MSVSVNAKLIFKGILYALLGVVVAALGIGGIGFFGDYFAAHPLIAAIPLSPTLGIDVYGAIAPIILAVVSLALFAKVTKGSVKRFAAAFSVTLVLAYSLCHLTENGLAGYPLLFSIIASMVGAAVNVFPRPFADLKKNAVSTILLTLVCVPFSLIAVDSLYSPYFESSVIGGSGLSDGLLLSTLYAPLSVIGVFSVLAYMSQMALLLGRHSGISTVHVSPKVKPSGSQD